MCADPEWEPPVPWDPGLRARLGGCCMWRGGPGNGGQGSRAPRPPLGRLCLSPGPEVAAQGPTGALGALSFSEDVQRRGTQRQWQWTWLKDRASLRRQGRGSGMWREGSEGRGRPADDLGETGGGGGRGAAGRRFRPEHRAAKHGSAAPDEDPGGGSSRSVSRTGQRPSWAAVTLRTKGHAGTSGAEATFGTWKVNGAPLCTHPTASARLQSWPRPRLVGEPAAWTLSSAGPLAEMGLPRLLRDACAHKGSAGVFHPPPDPGVGSHRGAVPTGHEATPGGVTSRGNRVCRCDEG